MFQVFAIGFFATMCLLLPYVSSEDPDKGTEVLGYVASLLTVAFRQVQDLSESWTPIGHEIVPS